MISDPWIFAIYRAVFAGDAVGCPLLAAQCSSDSDCDNSKAAHLCVAGICEKRCAVDWSPFGDLTNCDPCTEQCTAGYCQLTEGEVDPWELGVDLFKAYLDAYAMGDPANPGASCATVVDVFDAHAHDGSGTFTLPLSPGAPTTADGPCTLINFFDPDDKSEFKVSGGCPAPNGNETETVEVIEYQPNPNGECNQVVRNLQLKASTGGEQCHRVESHYAATVLSGLQGFGITQKIIDELEAENPVYAKVACGAEGMRVTWSVNEDCSPTPGGLNPEVCSEVGNMLDASSCCVATLLAATACVEPHVHAEIATKIDHMEATCSKPGNTAYCPSTPSRLQACSSPVLVDNKVVLALTKSQAGSWEKLSEQQQQQAISQMLGARSDRIKKVAVGPDNAEGSIVVDLRSTAAENARLRSSMKIAAAGTGDGLTVDVDGTDVSVSASSLATAAGEGSTSTSGAAVVAVVPASVVAAAVAAVSAMGVLF